MSESMPDDQRIRDLALSVFGVDIDKDKPRIVYVRPADVLNVYDGIEDGEKVAVSIEKYEHIPTSTIVRMGYSKRANVLIVRL
jgi:hypothetical protein